MRHFWLGVWMLLAATGAAFMGGCVQTGGMWDHKVVLASDLTPSAVDGQWEGSWQSYGYLDNGLVHMVIVPADIAKPAEMTPSVATPPAPGTQRYLARVKMWHYGIFAPEEFEMVLISSPGTDGQIQFRGSHDLGPLDGDRKFTGFVDSSKAVMWYVDRKDFGSVALHRVVNAVK